MNQKSDSTNTKKLEGRGTSGDFVPKWQTMAEDQGFGKVSKEWYDEGTTSIDAEIEHLTSTRSERETIYTEVDKLIPTRVEGKFAFRDERGVDLFPDQYSVGQMGSFWRIGAHYPRTLLASNTDESSEILELVFDHIRRTESIDKSCMLKVHGGDQLRAVLPASHCHVRSDWYLGVLKRGIPDASLSHWRGSEYTIYGNLLIPDAIREESDSKYGAMISLSNCELGTRKFRQRPSLFRAICRNGFVHNETRGRTFNLKKLGVIELPELEKLLIKQINEQIPLVQNVLDGLLGTREFESKIEMKAVFAQLCKERRFSRDQGTSILRAHAIEKAAVPDLGNTLFSVINSVTRASQTQANDVWVRFDELGGELSQLKRDDWDGWVSRAANLKSEDVERAFTSGAVTSAEDLAA